MSPRPDGSRVAFVLSGGASLGAIQVGMLRALLDEGIVVDNTPISQAIALGARRIYVLPTGAPCALSAPPRGALAMLMAQAEAGARGFLRGHAGTVVPLRGQAA